MTPLRWFIRVSTGILVLAVAAAVTAMFLQLIPEVAAMAVVVVLLLLGAPLGLLSRWETRRHWRGMAAELGLVPAAPRSPVPPLGLLPPPSNDPEAWKQAFQARGMSELEVSAEQSVADPRGIRTEPAVEGDVEGARLRAQLLWRRPSGEVNSKNLWPETRLEIDSSFLPTRFTMILCGPSGPHWSLPGEFLAEVGREGGVRVHCNRPELVPRILDGIDRAELRTLTRRKEIVIAAGRAVLSGARPNLGADEVRAVARLLLRLCQGAASALASTGPNQPRVALERQVRGSASP